MKQKIQWLPILLAALLLSGCSGGEEEIIRPADGIPTETFPSTTASEEVSIPETELYRAGGITVTATALEDGLFGPSVSMVVINDSGQNVTITSQQLSVNGYMLPASGFYCEVAAGKKALEKLTLLSTELEQAGIGTIGEIAFYLTISHGETYEMIAQSGLITLNTSVSSTFTQPAMDGGQPVYEDSGIRVVCLGLKKDAIWDGTVAFYLENNSDRATTVYAEHVSVNGYMADVSLWTDLRPGTKAVDGMYLMDLEELDLTDIHDIGTIEFSLRIVDRDNWDEVGSAGPITLTFS